MAPACAVEAAPPKQTGPEAEAGENEKQMKCYLLCLFCLGPAILDLGNQ
jgi:hypothetical protein